MKGGKHMQSQRYEKGLKIFRALYGEAADTFTSSLSDIAPSVADYSIEFVYGDIYERMTLDLKQRQLLTIAALTAMGGCEPQLKVHIGASLNAGLTAAEIVEAIIHCIPFSGFPKALNAIAAARSVFEEKNIIPAWGPNLDRG
jgi:4-carboxymuconolactone decarboxylase